MDLIRDIADKNLVWAPILMVLLISLIGFGIGFWNGWKTSAYFFAWNLVTTLTLVLVTNSMYNGTIKDWARDLMPKSVEDTLGQEAFTKTLDLFKGITVLLVLLVGLITVNLIALVTYFFVRKHLKRDIFLNKKNGISNATSRIVGGGIGFLSALPVAATLGVMTTGVSQNEGVNKWTSGLAKMVTFGEVKEASQDIRRVYNLALTADTSEALVKMFSAGTLEAKDVENILKNSDSLKNILNDQTSMETVLVVMERYKLSAPKPIEASDISSLESSHKELKGLLAEISTQAQKNLTDLLKAVNITDDNGLLMKFLLGTK